MLMIFEGNTKIGEKIIKFRIAVHESGFQGFKVSGFKLSYLSLVEGSRSESFRVSGLKSFGL